MSGSAASSSFSSSSDPTAMLMVLAAASRLENRDVNSQDAAAGRLSSSSTHALPIVPVVPLPSELQQLLETAHSSLVAILQSAFPDRTQQLQRQRDQIMSEMSKIRSAMSNMRGMLAMFADKCDSLLADGEEGASLINNLGPTMGEVQKLLVKSQELEESGDATDDAQTERMQQTVKLLRVALDSEKDYRSEPSLWLARCARAVAEAQFWFSPSSLSDTFAAVALAHRALSGLIPSFVTPSEMKSGLLAELLAGRAWSLGRVLVAACDQPNRGLEIYPDGGNGLLARWAASEGLPIDVRDVVHFIPLGGLDVVDPAFGASAAQIAQKALQDAPKSAHDGELPSVSPYDQQRQDGAHAEMREIVHLHGRGLPQMNPDAEKDCQEILVAIKLWSNSRSDAGPNLLYARVFREQLAEAWKSHSRAVQERLLQHTPLAQDVCSIVAQCLALDQERTAAANVQQRELASSSQGAAPVVPPPLESKLGAVQQSLKQLTDLLHGAAPGGPGF
jgi:hypothetical protein